MPWFYPDPVFGWTFYAVLVGFLVVATYADVGTMRIPKAVTLSMLGVGLLFSVVRGAWLGTLLEGTTEPGVVWHFARSPVLGALDGVLCALEGFLVAFLLFTGLYFLGVMKGGDVKLVAALGTWVGPVIVLMLVLGSVPTYLVLGIVIMARKALRQGVQKTVFDVKHKARGSNIKKTRGKPQRRVEAWLAYSVPIAISAAVILAAIVIRDQRHPIPTKDPSAEQASVQP